PIPTIRAGTKPGARSSPCRVVSSFRAEGGNSQVARPAIGGPGRSRLPGGALFVLLVPEEFLARDLFLGHGGELGEEIDDLLFEDRRSYRRDRTGVLSVVVPDFLLAAGHLAGALHDGARELVLGHGDLVLLADFREHEAQPHPPLGDAAIFLPRLLFGRALVGQGAAPRLEVGLDRVPDVLELVFGERGREREFMHLVELIEQLAFEPLATEPGVLLLEAPLDRRRELVERFQAQRFCKRIVDGDRPRRFERFDRDVELGGFAGELGIHVVGWKRDLHHPRFATAHADELVLEPRNKGAGSDIDADVAAAAAFERHAVDLAGKVDDDAVAFFHLRPVRLGGERPVLLSDLVECFLDLRVGDLRDLALELDALEIRQLDLRQYLERERIGEVGLSADDLFDRGRFVRNRDLRFHGELETAVADDLGVELADYRLDGLGHHRLAVDLPQVRDRHLAGAEAAQLDAILE